MLQTTKLWLRFFFFLIECDCTEQCACWMHDDDNTIRYWWMNHCPISIGTFESTNNNGCINELVGLIWLFVIPLLSLFLFLHLCHTRTYSINFQSVYHCSYDLASISVRVRACMWKVLFLRDIFESMCPIRTSS